MPGPIRRLRNNNNNNNDTIIEDIQQQLNRFRNHRRRTISWVLLLLGLGLGSSSSCCCCFGTAMGGLVWHVRGGMRSNRRLLPGTRRSASSLGWSGTTARGPSSVHGWARHESPTRTPSIDFRGTQRSWPLHRATTTRVRLRLFSSSSRNDANAPASTDPKLPPHDLSGLARSVRDAITTLVDTTTEPPNRNSCVVVPIVVAVSGGCDSVALFHALLEWKEHLEGQPSPSESSVELDVTVVHFHHRQRPIEADKDCQLVRQLVESYNNHKKDNNNSSNTNQTTVAFRLEDWKDRIDPEHDASRDASFSQDTARMWRRRCLQDCARDTVRRRRRHDHVPFGIVLTAHHDDDSYETVLLKLLRGVHLLNLHDKATIAGAAVMESPPPTRSNQGTTTDHDEVVYLVRPFVTDAAAASSTTRGHTKEDLVRYLTERNLVWREDVSNNDPKYLRNRVRNELIPLLRDLTEDSFRTQRIPALLRQSRAVSEDLEPRIQDYLASAVATNGDDGHSIFAIADAESALVRSQALYRWMSSGVKDGKDTDRTLSSPFVSHETLERVVRQLEDHPDNRAWTLELGSGWSVERVGTVLKLNSSNSNSNDGTGPRSWVWTRVSDQGAKWPNREELDENTVFLRVPASFLEALSPDPEFVSLQLHEAEADHNSNTNNALRFTPPWRNAPVKLRAFLRGQKVPAHLRDSTPLLFLTTSGEASGGSQPRLVAVWVRDKWIVDQEFSIDRSPGLDSSETSTAIVLKLSKTN